MSGNKLQRYTVDGVGRVYFDDSDYYPSVTTVLNEMETPVAIERWKKNNDGTGDSEHWEDIMDYKSNRGTLIHYHLLNEFSDEDMWSDDESSSESMLRNDYEDWQRFEDELFWATHQAWPIIKRIRGIDEDAVIDVEHFVRNEDVGYAGQFDLLYRDQNDDVILADVKTSKGVYLKHKLQLTAYEQAVDIEVDRVEVIRVNPDHEEWEVSPETDWIEDKVDLWADFLELRQQVDDERIAELRETARGKD